MGFVRRRFRRNWHRHWHLNLYAVIRVCHSQAEFPFFLNFLWPLSTWLTHRNEEIACTCTHRHIKSLRCCCCFLWCLTTAFFCSEKNRKLKLKKYYRTRMRTRPFSIYRESKKKKIREWTMRRNIFRFVFVRRHFQRFFRDFVTIFHSCSVDRRYNKSWCHFQKACVTVVLCCWCNKNARLTISQLNRNDWWCAMTIKISYYYYFSSNLFYFSAMSLFSYGTKS